MTTYYKYRLKCTTDNINEYWILSENDPVPTTCPTNTAHTIDSTQTTIVDTISDTQISIKEEETPTGGSFAVQTLKFTATKNSISSKSLSWPFPISALSVNFITSSEHSGDCICAFIGQNTITGAITEDVSPASAWTAQNYTVGQTVTYTHPTHGDRCYTCIVNTVSNEIPTNTAFWRHGLEISVSSTVIANVYIGYQIKLYDGVNTDDVERVLFIDTENSKIYVETNLTNSFLVASPTYIKQTVFMFKDYDFQEPWEHEIGQSKIGGSYIPKDTIVKISYNNKSIDTDKIFIGRIEYLY
jgi:hypothetical protein